MKQILTCTKRYSDIPFAHRQPNHAGHCSLLHGHNWSFEFEFIAKELDECGFVIDFGKLKPVKAFLDKLDHALVLNEDDVYMAHLINALLEVGIEQTSLAKIVRVPDCSAEGLAKWAFEAVTKIVFDMTGGRVTVRRCTVFEDSRNSATYEIA